MDGGATWDSLSCRSSFYEEIITDMHFIDQDTGWFCGKVNAGSGFYGILGKTEDSGKFIDFSEYYNAGPGIKDVLSALASITFFDDQNGWAIGDETYYTKDCGQSWHKAKDNKLSHGNNSMFVIDETTGWIVGYDGKILKTQTGGLTEIETGSHLATNPNTFHLYQNYPNPFNASTTIRYYLADRGHVEVVIYDITGKVVARLVNKNMSSGEHTLKWAIHNISSGIYFYQLQHNGSVKDTKRLVLLK
jgi:hypothetical protein